MYDVIICQTPPLPCYQKSPFGWPPSPLYSDDIINGQCLITRIKFNKRLTILVKSYLVYIDKWKTKICLFLVSNHTDHFLCKNEENRVVKSPHPPKLR